VPRRNQSSPTKAAKPLDRATIEERALAYLNRFDASAARLRRVLEQFVRRRAKELDVDATPFIAMVQETIARYERSGLLDDRRFSESIARSLVERGASRQAIKAKLHGRGVPASVIDEVIGELARAGGSELDAAKALVRKRKLGAMRPVEDRKAHFRKDLGILARAGFGFDTARAALNVGNIGEDEDF
jgi:regulatory protein